MQNLKLLSLNLHCLEEKKIPDKQQIITNQIIDLDIDVVFLQEVAQYSDDPIVIENISNSNYGYQLQQMLSLKGVTYYFYFEPIKFSFNKYEEGVGLLSKYPLENVEGHYLSKIKDYQDWHTRKCILGDLDVNDVTITLASTHLGWSEGVEVYQHQALELSQVLKGTNFIIGGDFNVKYGSPEYQDTVALGFVDLFGLNNDYKYAATHINDMDIHDGETRIDYIFSSKKYSILDQDILFRENRVSDHYGVYIVLNFE